MLSNYNADTQELTISDETFLIKSRKRIKGYEYFKLENGHNIVSNGEVYFYTPNSILGKIRMPLYENRPPRPEKFTDLTKDTLIDSLEEGIDLFKSITGACEGGIKTWLNETKLPPFPIKFKWLIFATKGLFGHDLLKESINPTGKILFMGAERESDLIVYKLSPEEEVAMLNLELQTVLQ